MDTLAERIEWILQNCRTDTGEEWTARRLSKAAGLGESHVGMLQRGGVKNPGNDTLEAIARAAKVSYRWLGAGQGLPTDADPAGPGRSTFADLPRWEELLATAQTLAPEIPPWVWIEVGRSSPLLTSPATPGMLVDVAKLVMRHMQPPKRHKTTSA